MNINEMTRKDFEALPLREWTLEPFECDNVVILPGRKLHDSGYRLMDFVAVIKNKPIFRLSGCSDVLCLEGLGGLGYNWAKDGFPKMVLPSGWMVDCLPKSGLLRIFSNKKIMVGGGLASFEIWTVPTKNEKSRLEVLLTFMQEHIDKEGAALINKETFEQMKKWLRGQ